MKGRRLEKKKSLLGRILDKIGFTNCMAVCLMAFLFATLVGGFTLAVLSIRYQYTGALACWTIIVTPLDTAIGIVLGRIVKKSETENRGANGEGIKYALATANIINSDPTIIGTVDSPGI